MREGSLLRTLRPVVLSSLVLWLITGLLYPLAMTGIGQALFPYQANGSLYRQNGKVVGSLLVGQNFWGNPDFFWGRPSATVSVSTGKPEPYNPYASSPSNLGPTNRQLVADVQQRIRTLRSSTPGLKVSQIPEGLVTSSGSGLDPNISVQAAMIQIPRVAKNTGIPRPYLHNAVINSTSGPQYGMFGRRRVNVLELNTMVAKYLTTRGKHVP